MNIYVYNEKEFKLIPRTRKVIDLTKKLKAKNLNDLLFNALNDVNVEILAEVIKTFSENEDGKPTFSSVSNAYDFIDEWKEKNNKSYADLFKEIIEVVNEMGFFKTKMTAQELKQNMENPIMNLNLQELAMNSAQKAMDEIAMQEFTGYKG